MSGPCQEDLFSFFILVCVCVCLLSPVCEHMFEYVCAVLSLLSAASGNAPCFVKIWELSQLLALKSTIHRVDLFGVRLQSDHSCVAFSVLNS